VSRETRKLGWIVGLLGIAFLLLPTSANAQTYTSVSATITDPNGLPYSGALITFSLTPHSGQATIAPCPQSPCPVHVPGTAQADATGTFTVTLLANASMLPAGIQWTIGVTEPGVPLPWGTGPQQFTYTFTAAGASQNLSVAMSALAPSLIQIPIPSGGICGKGAGATVGYLTKFTATSPCTLGDTLVDEAITLPNAITVSDTAGLNVVGAGAFGAHGALGQIDPIAAGAVSDAGAPTSNPGGSSLFDVSSSAGNAPNLFFGLFATAGSVFSLEANPAASAASNYYVGMVNTLLVPSTQTQTFGSLFGSYDVLDYAGSGNLSTINGIYNNVYLDSNVTAADVSATASNVFNHSEKAIAVMNAQETSASDESAASGGSIGTFSLIDLEGFGFFGHSAIANAASLRVSSPNGRSSTVTNLYGIRILQQCALISTTTCFGIEEDYASEPNALGNLILKGVATSPSANPICPNGTGGTLTQSGCTAGNVNASLTQQVLATDFTPTQNTASTIQSVTLSALPAACGTNGCRIRVTYDYYISVGSQTGNCWVTDGTAVWGFTGEYNVNNQGGCSFSGLSTTQYSAGATPTISTQLYQYASTGVTVCAFRSPTSANGTCASGSGTLQSYWQVEVVQSN